jgi:hypothetical protein
MAVAIDIFPAKPAWGGDAIAFPILKIESDNNPSLTAGDACLTGQFPGSWH